MTDQETIEAMLRRAKITYDVVEHEGSELDYPEPNVTIEIESSGEQPYPDGYDFITGIAFAKDGRLVAIWAWE